jgi:ketosteroid isomerase-like protein
MSFIWGAIMSAAIETEIIQVEERLRLAMLASDVGVLDQLLAPELLCTSHLGEIVTKQADLAAHASGAFKINKLQPSEQHIQLHGEVAIVSVRMQLSGSYQGNPANGDFRFTRVWAVAESGAWQIVAAHIGMIA